MLAVCLAIHECNKSDIEKQNVTIMILKEQNDSLFKANFTKYVMLRVEYSSDSSKFDIDNIESIEKNIIAN